MRDLALIQNDRGGGKTTALLDEAARLIRSGASVAILTADETRARWLRDRARDTGLPATRLNKGVFVVLGESAAFRLRGSTHRILADDVDDWDDGIDSPSLRDLWDRVDVVTASPNPEPTLRMLRRGERAAVEADRRRRYGAEREARAAAERRMMRIMHAQIKGLSYAAAVALVDAVERGERPRFAGEVYSRSMT